MGCVSLPPSSLRQRRFNAVPVAVAADPSRASLPRNVGQSAFIGSSPEALPKAGPLSNTGFSGAGGSASERALNPINWTAW